MNADVDEHVSDDAVSVSSKISNLGTKKAIANRSMKSYQKDMFDDVESPMNAADFSTVKFTDQLDAQ